MKKDNRFLLDHNIIIDGKHHEKYECTNFIHAEKIFHILCYQELKLKLMKAELRNSQYKLNLMNVKMDLIDDLIMQQIAEYSDNSYTPAGTTQTKTAYNKIDALKKFKKELPIGKINERNKISALLKLRKELGLMSDEDCEELKKQKLNSMDD